MIAIGLVAAACAAVASPQDPAPAPKPAAAPKPALSLRVVAPLDSSEIAALQKAFDARAAEIGAALVVDRIVALGPDELEPGTLLLGYERGLLDALEHDGALAPREPGGAVVSFAWEAWTPAWSIAPGADPPPIDSFASLLAPELRGRVVLRRPVIDSSEGLILGALALSQSLGDSDDELGPLVVASDARGTIVSDTMSFETLLRGLPGGAATLVPVRAAAAAMKAERPITWTLPKEGFFSLELAAALTRESSAEALAWFERRFDAVVAPIVREAAALEGAAVPGKRAPEWQRVVAASRAEFDRAAADRLRLRLARLYSSLPVGSERDDEGFVERWVDRLLLGGALVAMVVLALRHGRGGGDRRSGGVV